ncbi:3-hydroxyacyl-CoA dehydrogenase family protein [Novosphingobium sp. 2638]|uniref:3-hydroxyacyl-CoA dehydrogenase family protein n=2 Tax=Novosphingobium beihaiensis TaxID=2930389 RepID=A0ABT0BRQ3_9SPHN|nr:3-hydroxyacyl-CoA dehydrogenase family protein [Novosphingobium beihaiensis]
MARKVGVVGSGMMGSEIALVYALAGFSVKICDQSAEQVQSAIERLKGVLEQGIAKNRYTREQADAALANLEACDSLESYADRDLVVEAVFEDIDVKGAIFERLAKVLPETAIMMTNTSSISITALGGRLPEERRGRFVGTHFFSPVSRMALVEVIPGIDTDPQVADEVMQLMRDIAKEPIHVKDVVGFAVNRMLHIFFIEAIRLVEEGAVSAEDIDKACKLGLGHPVGPFELMDLTDTKLSMDVQQIMQDHYGDRFMPRQLLKAIVAAGYRGRKTGRGWHRYDAKGKRIPA